MKIILKVVAFLIALFLLCTLGLVGYEAITGKSLLSAAGESDSLAFAAPIFSSSAAGNSSSEDGAVYDSKNKALWYLKTDGTIFNEDFEVTTDSTSSPLYYNPQTGEFTNSKNNVLELLDHPSSRGKYLSDGIITARSFAVDDNYYELELKSGGVMYCYKQLGAAVKWGVREADFYNLWGNKQDRRIFTLWDEIKALSTQLTSNGFGSTAEDSNWNYWLGSSLNGQDIGDYILTKGFASYMPKKYPKYTLSELTEKIEILNEAAEVLPIKDDNGRNINVIDGQLFDYMDWPLIGADAKPVFYDGSKYYGIDGRPLTVVDGYLMDGDFIVHSIVGDLKRGEHLFILEMNSVFETTRIFCPLYGEPIVSNDGYVYEAKYTFYYLNNEPIDTEDFRLWKYKFSLENLYDRHPEYKPPAPKGWLEKLLEDIGAFFAGIFNFLNSIFNTSTFETILLLIGLAVFIAVVVKLVKWSLNN